jgi:hypothetical protein
LINLQQQQNLENLSSWDFCLELVILFAQFPSYLFSQFQANLATEFFVS